MMTHRIRISLKSLMAAVCLAVSCSGVCPAESLDVFTREIRGQRAGQAEEIRVKQKGYDAAVFRHVSFRRHSTGGRDLLRVSGTIENRQNVYMADAEVVIELFDKAGNPAGQARTRVLPRIIRLKGRKEGRFSVDIDHPEALASCELDIDWQGKGLTRTPGGEGNGGSRE